MRSNYLVLLLLTLISCGESTSDVKDVGLYVDGGRTFLITSFKQKENIVMSECEELSNPQSVIEAREKCLPKGDHGKTIAKKSFVKVGAEGLISSNENLKKLMRRYNVSQLYQEKQKSILEQAQREKEEAQKEYDKLKSSYDNYNWHYSLRMKDIARILAFAEAAGGEEYLGDYRAELGRLRKLAKRWHNEVVLREPILKEKKKFLDETDFPKYIAERRMGYALQQIESSGTLFTVSPKKDGFWPYLYLYLYEHEMKAR